MTYFQCASLILGAMLALGGLWFLVAPGNYRSLAVRFLPEKRPGWFLLSSLAMLAWVAYSWLRFFEAPGVTAAVVSFILSLTLIKAYFATFRYPDFRSFALKFVDLESSILQTLSLIYILLAAALFAIGRQ
ncbi:MAG: hypothetical protein HYY57_02280 [Candidatus Omnitrophica bacterium]|nr:hypothetical protein [Candidatus Omnitrophota bacterium]